MKITYKGDYALKAILDLALNYGRLVTIHELAARADMPLKFLEQVLLDLKKGGFGKVIRAHKSRLIALVDFDIQIDGPIEPIACVEKGYSGCDNVYRCVFRKVWQKVAASISDIVDTITFEDLANQVRSAKEEPVYSI